MAGFTFELDPVSEDAANAALNLSDGTNLIVLSEPEPDLSPPDIDGQWATSSDTEGSVPASTKHQNRRIAFTVRAYGGTASGLDAQLAKLQQKVGKITRESGTLKVTVPSGKTVVFDLLDAQATTPIKRRLATNFIAETALSFTAKPYGRGAAVQKSLRSETTLPALIFTETAVGGDVPALGKLEVTDAQGADQWWAIYGLQSKTYDSASTAALFYQAEALTLQGGAVSQSVADASGGTAIANLALSTNWQSMLSTQVSGGSHLSHVGEYLVIARVRSSTNNSDDVQLRLEWSHGDLRAPTRNDPVTLTAITNAWFLANLGTISIPKVQRGTQQWEGRVLARAEFPNDDAYVDYLLLVPLEASGEISAVAPTASPTSFVARDEFTQSAGALTGKTAAVGGTWAGAGDTDDFTINTTADTAERTAVSDAIDVPRRMRLPVTAMTDTVAQVDFMAATMPTANLWAPGLILRHDTASGRHLRVSVQAFNGIVAYAFFTNDTSPSVGLVTGRVPVLEAGAWYTLRALADAAGRLFVWFGPQGGQLGLVLSQYVAALDTGGSSASGVPGFFDYKIDANAQTRSFDNFSASAPPRDAAVFASQSAEIRYDGAIREDAAGAIWTPVSRFEGDLLRVPPAGQEGRTVRVLVKAARNPPGVMSDPAIDDLNAQLTVIQRYLELPE